jgi:hypothetical protein
MKALGTLAVAERDILAAQGPLRIVARSDD